MAQKAKDKTREGKKEAQKAFKIAGDWGNQGVCWMKLVNKLPKHTQRSQEGMHRKNIICRARVFWTYILWCHLKHLLGSWRHLWHIYSNVRPFHDMIIQISEHSLKGKYSLFRRPYINTVRYYWWKICGDRILILSVTFITLIFLKDC